MWDSLAKWSRDPRKGREAAGLFLLLDCVLTLVTTQTVPHFNIDWTSYMQQAGNLSLSSSTYNYSQLVGDNGPLVYPAGHAWIYLGLHQIVEGGTNTRLAQYIACLVYIANLSLVFRMLLRTEKLPPYVLAIISLGATRVRCLTVIHLFNDPLATLCLHASINMFLDGHWKLGSVFYSLGVSIKMNILLYSPALLCIYLAFLGIQGTAIQLGICASIQILLAAPFLLGDPRAYITAAFNLNRRFLHRDSVNFSFLSKDIFGSGWFHVSLLIMHISILLFCSPFWWHNLKKAATMMTCHKKIDSNNNSESVQKLNFTITKKIQDKWRTHLWVVCIGLAAKLIISLPNFHPVLVHGLFWPSLSISLTFPAIIIANLRKIKIFETEITEKVKLTKNATKTNLILFPFFLCNFIGVVFSRSVHVQFYLWYFYSLHYLVWNTTFTEQFKLLILSFTEFSYFSLELNTVIGFWFHNGSNQWMMFETWANTVCSSYISKKRDIYGYEVEFAEPVPDYCRRGTQFSSLIFQAAHWALLLNLLWKTCHGKRFIKKVVTNYQGVRCENKNRWSIGPFDWFIFLCKGATQSIN